MYVFLNIYAYFAKWREVTINYWDNNKREKGVEVGWIPPKRANTTGKSGTVTFIWLVDPNGKIDGDTVYVISSGITELLQEKQLKATNLNQLKILLVACIAL